MDAAFRFSDDPTDVDRSLVHHWLSEQSYWAAGRSREALDRAVDGSLNFGVYERESGRQVAYARVVTDRATFAWLCDVFVDPDLRGQGIGHGLLDGVLAVLDPMGLRRVLLATRDAHGLYAAHGFTPLPEPDRFMVRS
mgnify:CR=1 FL=1